MAGEMKLGKLLGTLEDRREEGIIPSQHQATVQALACDSRLVEPGTVFVAVKGPWLDGHDYISEALSKGALAIVAQRPITGAPCVVVPDSQLALGKLAQAFYAEPGQSMTKIAVTGTNGKTTFCYILRSILKAAGHESLMFGTIGHMIGQEFAPAGNTTPGPLELAELMGKACSAGIRYVVLEASSHALDQGRLAGLNFEVAVFTNLSGDHLDYHGSMEQYLQAKAILFEGLTGTATAVLNRDDPASQELAKRTQAKNIWYGLSSDDNVWASDLSGGVDGSRFVLNCAGSELKVKIQLAGRHNVMNALAAAGAAMALGVDGKTIAQGIAQLEAVPGRLEAVNWDGPFQVLVDYAHTHDALGNVLRALRAITKNKLIVVFGCGGDRDKTKRPKMGAAASAQADKIFVTNDNPRTEDPTQIIQQILAGISSQAQDRTQVIADRQEAIHAALSSAQPSDVVLIAGKGHETYQIIGTERRPFDDRQVVAQWLSKNGLRGTK